MYRFFGFPVRKIFLLLIVFLIASYSSAGLISNTLKANASDPTQVTTDAISTTGADLIVLIVSYYNPGGSPTVSDSASNSATYITSQVGTFGSGCAIYYYDHPTTSGSHTFTVSGASNYPTISVMAWSGADSSPLDQSNQGPGGSSSIQLGSVTPSQDGELIVTGLTVNNGSSITLDSGFTISNAWDAIPYNFATGMGYLVQGAASAVNPTWSYSTSPPDNGAAVIATFKGNFALAGSEDVFFGDGL